MQPIDEVHRAAQAGNAEAQELLAAVLDELGRPEDAVGWLRRAAEGGRAGAAVQLGLREIVGQGTAQDPGSGVRRIVAAAERDAAAAHMAAVLYAGGVAAPRRLDRALELLARAARGGDARAACQLGLLVGTEGDGAATGLALLELAAAAGFDPAQHALGAALIRGDAGQQARARAWLEAAAAAGNPCAAKLADPAGGSVAPPAGVEGPIDWDRAAAADLSGWSARTAWREERESPRIATAEDFLPDWACDYVAGLAAPALQRGKVVDEHGGESVRGVRTNAVTHFGLGDSDVLLELINQRTADAAGMPPENAEGLGVLHYRPGETYARHVDYIDPSAPQNAAHLAARGQRVKTLLVYLNHDFEGGETEFVRLGMRFKPPRGAALLFESVLPSGEIDPRTLHAGLPPTRGEKWLISKWFRTKALRPTSAA
ncbi:MAG TPA: 2OG-Fe(II) oxygenase [Caulobacteraceae bacterium]|jgi:prolyl 4-hydroxylase